MTVDRRLPGFGTGLTTAAATMTLLAALPGTQAFAQVEQAALNGVELKLLTPRAGDALGSAQFALDVAFESKTKSPVVTAELWVDGVRWVRRDLDTPQLKNVLSFAVDGSSLAEGKHNLQVKVFTAEGKASQVAFSVWAGNKGGTVEGSISGPEMLFRTLTNGQRVQGTVEVLLDAKEQNGVNPYITIFVDSQFKTLKNYPPYSYSWDTTKVANGYHTIEATGYLDANGASSTRKLKVFVDNPGGNTEFKSDVPDLSAARQQAAPTAATATATPLSIPLPNKRPVLQPEGEPVVTEATVAPRLAIGTSGLAAVKEAAIALPSATRSVAPSVAAPSAKPIVVRPASVVAPRVSARAATPVVRAAVSAVRFTTSATMQSAPLANPAVTSAPSVSAPLSLAAPRTAPVAAVAATPVRATSVMGNTKAIPAAAPVRFATVTARQKVTQIRSTRSNPRAVVRPEAWGLQNAIPAAKGLQVAFDGQQIAFDVQPRVEAGLPIAPFRQIFEHTGGQVMWVPGSRVVRAVNADREIVLKIGQNQARVNGETVTMARPATVEAGRTIVPLSFVGQAMDVDVQYDPATGRLSITSK